MTLRRYLYIIYAIIVLAIMGCMGSGDTKDAAQMDSSLNDGFDQAINVADSLYSCMQFRDAYDLYLQLLDSKEVKADSEKRLNVLPPTAVSAHTYFSLCFRQHFGMTPKNYRHEALESGA